MFGPVSLATGALIWLAGYGGGRVGRARRRPSFTPVKAVCECTHVFSMHSAREPHPCQNPEMPGLSVSCRCQRYTGPLPVAEIADL